MHMEAMPPEAMAGMGPMHMEAMPPEAMAGMDAPMMEAMPPEAMAGMEPDAWKRCRQRRWQVWMHDGAAEAWRWMRL